MAMDMALHLTDEEAAALDALTAGVSQLAERAVETEAAVAAALDFCLTRLTEDFEIPDTAVREQVAHARERMREHWSRGNACL
jgi:hypothetical protein